MTDFFEDMWLSMENSLKEFDSYTPGNEFQQQPLAPDQQQSDQQINIDPQTYEDLLERQHAPQPSKERLRNHSLQERIKAVRELYNQTPTIINWASIDRIKRVADGMYKIGLVKEANEIVEKIEAERKVQEKQFNWHAQELASMLYHNVPKLGKYHLKQMAKIAISLQAPPDPYGFDEFMNSWSALVLGLTSPHDDLEYLQSLVDKIEEADVVDNLQSVLSKQLPIQKRKLKLFQDAKKKRSTIAQFFEWEPLLSKWKAEADILGDVSSTPRTIYEYFLEGAKEWLDANSEDRSTAMLGTDAELREYAKQKQETKANQSSLTTLQKIAKNLAERGLVKEANEIIEKIENVHRTNIETYNESVAIGYNQQAIRSAKQLFAGESFQEIGEAWLRLTRELKSPDSNLEECEKLIETIKGHDHKTLTGKLKELYTDPEGGLGLFERKLSLFRQARDELDKVDQPQDLDNLIEPYRTEDIGLKRTIYLFFLDKAKKWLDAHPEDLASFLISKIPELREYAQEKGKTKASTSQEKLKTIADKLARKGLVAEANQIMEQVNNLASKANGELTNIIKMISE